MKEFPSPMPSLNRELAVELLDGGIDVARGDLGCNQRPCGISTEIRPPAEIFMDNPLGKFHGAVPVTRFEGKPDKRLLVLCLDVAKTGELPDRSLVMGTEFPLPRAGATQPILPRIPSLGTFRRSGHGAPQRQPFPHRIAAPAEIPCHDEIPTRGIRLKPLPKMTGNHFNVVVGDGSPSLGIKSLARCKVLIFIATHGEIPVSGRPEPPDPGMPPAVP